MLSSIINLQYGLHSGKFFSLTCGKLNNTFLYFLLIRKRKFLYRFSHTKTQMPSTWWIPRNILNLKLCPQFWPAICMQICSVAWIWISICHSKWRWKDWFAGCKCGWIFKTYSWISSTWKCHFWFLLESNFTIYCHWQWRSNIHFIWYN